MLLLKAQPVHLFAGADILPNARSKNMEGYKGKFKTWKEIREKLFFFQKLMNFENVLNPI
jgi:hypothetical protein